MRMAARRSPGPVRPSVQPDRFGGPGPQDIRERQHVRIEPRERGRIVLSDRRAVALALAASIAFGVAAAPSAADTRTRSRHLEPAQADFFPGFPGVGTGAVGAAPGGSASGTCGLASGPDGQGTTAGASNQVCEGAGVTNIAPTIGQATSVIGPTIAAGAVIGTQVTTSGDVAAG